MRGRMHSTSRQPPAFTYAHHTSSTGGSLDFDMSFAGIDLINDPINIDNSAFDLLAGKDVCPLAEFCMAYPDPFDQSARAFSVPATQFDPVVGQIASDQSSPDANDYNPRDYWLWNTGATKNTPALVTHSMENLLRVMRTWPKALAKGLKTPPMFHISNTHPGSMLWPLVNCVAIAKMWAGQSDGACTEIVRRAALQEMRSLFERVCGIGCWDVLYETLTLGQYRSMDDRHLIATLQALIMYTLIIMFPARGQMSVAIVDPAVFLCLQRVVNYVAKTGLFLKEEMDCVQPSWESWVHVTAKRRALLTLYLVHWSYSVYHDLESFACHQLGFMPAPAPKFLWEAETREKWTNLYSPWLAQWDDQPYMMSEFASIRPGTGLDPRSEKWLEDADELGNLFFSIGTRVHCCVRW